LAWSNETLQASGLRPKADSRGEPSDVPEGGQELTALREAETTISADRANGQVCQSLELGKPFYPRCHSNLQVEQAELSYLYGDAASDFWPVASWGSSLA